MTNEQDTYVKAVNPDGTATSEMDHLFASQRKLAESGKSLGGDIQALMD